MASDNRFAILYSNTTSTIQDGLLYTGEVAYTNADGDSDGGQRIFIGTGTYGELSTETITIGGDYYTNMMDHKRGHLAPLSAIITDANNKIDLLNVDDITIDGNDITSTSGSLTLDGFNDTIDVSNNRVINVADPTQDQDAVNKRFLRAETINIRGDNNVSQLNAFDPNDEFHLIGGFNLNTVLTPSLGNIDLKFNLDSSVRKLAFLNVDNVNIDGNTISTTSGDLVLDPTPVGAAGKVIIQGDLQVEGTTTTVNSQTLTINDKNIVLADGAATAAAADSAGITVSAANAKIWWDYPTDTWNFNKDVKAPNIDVTGSITVNGQISGQYTGFDSDFAAKTTDSLAEGDNNLYYTRARWDSALTTVTTTNLTEGDNLYYTQTRVDSAFDARLATKTTTDVAEGTRLYFTEQRVRDAIALIDAGGDGSLTYDSATGQFVYTGPSAAEVRAHFAAQGDLSYDSSTGVFSIDVEQIYTKANFDSDLGLASTDDLPEGSTNLYYTNTRFDDRLATKSTTNLAEGTNLYYTAERVDDRVSSLLHAGEGIDLNYNDGTNQLTVSTELASTLNPGVATFDSQDFVVTSGNVELNTIDCGTF